MPSPLCIHYNFNSSLSTCWPSRSRAPPLRDSLFWRLSLRGSHKQGTYPQLKKKKRNLHPLLPLRLHQAFSAWPSRCFASTGVLVFVQRNYLSVCLPVCPSVCVPNSSFMNCMAFDLCVSIKTLSGNVNILLSWSLQTKKYSLQLLDPTHAVNPDWNKSLNSTTLWMLTGSSCEFFLF